MVFPKLAKSLLQDHKFQQNSILIEKLVVVDSMPIMMTKGFRAHKCRTANDIASLGYCASKDVYYYGVKLHLFADYKTNSLALPKLVKIMQASVHNLTAVKEDIFSFMKTQILADKAYKDQKIKEKLKRIGSDLHTPVKFSKFKKNSQKSIQNQ